MRTKWMAVFWSVVMIAAGVVFLLRETGVIYFDQVPAGIGVVIFAILSGFFFLTYFLEGVRNWGWLFPAVILASLGLMLALTGTALGSSLSGAPVLLAVAVPFLVAFSFEPRKNWWALIPAWIMLCLSFVILSAGRVSGNLIGSFVMYSIALPFLVAFLLDRTRRWALIPFAALSVTGILPLLEEVLGGETLGFIVMFLFAAAFFVVFFWSKTNWWALIPAGVFTSVGLVVLYTRFLQPLQHSRGFDPAGTAMLLAGIGATFGALWLMRASKPTEWAKYPSLALFGFALLTLVLGANLQLFWPLALIAGGALIVVLALVRKPAASPEAPVKKSRPKKA
jgi:hypothetical protein